MAIKKVAITSIAPVFGRRHCGSRCSCKNTQYVTTSSERDVEEEEVQERLDFSATEKQEDTSDRGEQEEEDK